MVLSRKWSKVAILVIEILLIQLLMVGVFSKPSNANSGTHNGPVPYYIRALNVDSWYGRQRVGPMYFCFGASCDNTVANKACHAYCVDRHENAIYVLDDEWHNPPVYCEVGWMWDSTWAKPLWYVYKFNSGANSEFHLFTEQIAPGTNHNLKLQWVTTDSSTGQWRFYRDSGEICRINGVTVTWGNALVAGEKWNINDTNWSDFWHCRQRGFYNTSTGWSDWAYTGLYQYNDQNYYLHRLSSNSCEINTTKAGSLHF